MSWISLYSKSSGVINLKKELCSLHLVSKQFGPLGCLTAAQSLFSDPGLWPSILRQRCCRHNSCVSLQFGVSLSHHQDFGHIDRLEKINKYIKKYHLCKGVIFYESNFMVFYHIQSYFIIKKTYRPIGVRVLGPMDSFMNILEKMQRRVWFSFLCSASFESASICCAFLFPFPIHIPV